MTCLNREYPHPQTPPPKWVRKHLGKWCTFVDSFSFFPLEDDQWQTNIDSMKYLLFGGKKSVIPVEVKVEIIDWRTDTKISYPIFIHNSVVR